ncbi:MAG: zinc-binding dehydrogenase, partial [Deltaproteobacteria bacterium]|nr:zinc-binding dehydrogenase [Deltaproteobacteria bacterium]
SGVDVVLDSIGAPYLERNLRCLATDGALVGIGLMGGAKSEVHLGALLTRRLRIVGSTLRTRSESRKAAIVRGFLGRFGGDLAAGRIRPTIHEVFDLADAARAHQVMKASTHFGKLVLRIPSQGA